MTIGQAVEKLMDDTTHERRTHAVRYDQDGDMWASLKLIESRGRLLVSVMVGDSHPGNDPDGDQLTARDYLANDWEVSILA